MLIGKMHRTLREDEAGQAIILGAMTMFILAMSVMVTVQLGHAIDQRMKVQNAADNAAFSAAAVAARGLNFIAWVNRTEISHYVSMMALQTLASYVTGLQTIIWMLKDTIQSVAAIACVIAEVCQKCTAVPIIGAACAACYAIFKGVSVVANIAAQAMKSLLNGTWQVVDKLDLVIAKAVEIISLLNNEGMYLIAEAMKLATEAALAGNALGNFQESIITNTAGKANGSGVGTTYKVAAGALNTGLAGDGFSDLFNPDSDDIPKGGTEANNQSWDDNDEVQKAERMMAEFANATRTGDGSHYQGKMIESNRGWNNTGGLLSDVTKFLGFEYYGTTRLVMSQDCNKFTEGTADCKGSGGAISNNSGAKVAQAAQKCNSDQAKCDNFNKTQYEPAKQKCDSSTTTCNNCQKDPKADCSGPCNTAMNDCIKASDKYDEMEKVCKDGEKSCGALKDMGTKGNSAPDPKAANYVWLNGGNGTSQMNQGGAMSSAEWVKATGLSIISGGSAKVVGIQTWYEANDSAKSFHCHFPDQEKDRTIETEIWPGCPKYAITQSTQCYNENQRHKWYGIAKHIAFHADSSDKSRDEMFGQTDFWSLVNKDATEAKFGANVGMGFTGNGNFKFGTEFSGGKLNQGTAVSNAKGEMKDANKYGLNGTNSSLPLEGLNAWSRAQVYYHRTGAWAEPPNLYNPFWRAKLSPVGTKAAQLSSQVGLGALGGLLKDVLLH